MCTGIGSFPALLQFSFEDFFLWLNDFGRVSVRLRDRLYLFYRFLAKIYRSKRTVQYFVPNLRQVKIEVKNTFLPQNDATPYCSTADKIQ